MKRKILLVDDEESIIKSLIRVLNSIDNCEIMYTTDPDMVETLIKEHNPDLIIADVMMPGADGFEVVRRIKTNPSTQQVKIMSLSGNYPEGGKIMLESMGVIRCFDKPYNPEEFMQAVKDIISGYIND